MNLPRNVKPGQPVNTTPDYEGRRKFVEAYFETGSLTKGARAADIHMNTAQQWRKAKWFEEATRELKKALDRQFDGRITKNLEKVMSEIEDRLEKGDVKAFHHQGEVITERVPIGGKDLAVIAGVLFDKRTQIRKEPEQDDKAESALDRIADRLRQYAVTEKLQGNSEVVDVEVTEPEDGSDLV